jgi:hypothetical protein
MAYGVANPAALKGLSLGKVGAWIKANPAQAALLGAGLYSAARSGSERSRAESQLGGVEGIYSRLLEQSLPFASALQDARLQLLGEAMRSPDTSVAHARRALDAQLENVERRQAQSGLRALSFDRQRSMALSNFASQVAGIRAGTPWQRLAMLMGAGGGYDASALANLANLRAQRASQAFGLEAQTLSSLANLLPYILSEF